MDKKDLLLCLFLFIVGVFTRAPLIEQMQSHMDGPLYSLAVLLGYNYEQEIPAPPGYPLYIGLGKLIYTFVHNPHTALLFISVLFSGIGAVIFYLTGKVLFNRIVGLIAVFLFLSGSTFYYFGLTAYAYIITPVLTSILAIIVFFIFFKHRKLGIILGSFFAIQLGFRPQEIFQILPLFLLGFFSLPRKEQLKGVLSLVLLGLVWFIPLLQVSGGIHEYVRASTAAVKSNALPPPSLTYAIERHFILVQGLFLSFGIGNILLLYYFFPFLAKLKRGIHFLIIDKSIIFFSFWMIPSIFFNLFMRTEHAGYQMTYLSALSYLIANALYRLLGHKLFLLITGAISIVVFNLSMFFYNRDPNYGKPFRQTSFHYTDIRRNDREMKTKVAFIKANFDPKSTLILMGPVFWRQTMYYLPEYRILTIDALITKNPQYIYGVRDSYNWFRAHYQSKNFSFRAPENITTIVVLDEGYSWVNDNRKTIYSLPWNVKIVSFPVSPREKILYDYQYISIENHEK